MQAIAESIGKQKLTHQHFRSGVFTFDAAHVVTADFWGVYICHLSKLMIYSEKIKKIDGLVQLSVFIPGLFDHELEKHFGMQLPFDED